VLIQKNSTKRGTRTRAKVGLHTKASINLPAG